MKAEYKGALVPSHDETDMDRQDHESSYGPFSIGDDDEGDGHDDDDADATLVTSQISSLELPNVHKLPLHVALDDNDNKHEYERHRTIDSFLEEAYHFDGQNSLPCCGKICRRWPYYRMVIVIGSVNVVNTIQYECIRYLLADDEFQTDILNNKDDTLGPLLAGLILMGMIVGGLLTSLLESVPTAASWVGGRKSMLCCGLCFNLAGSLIMAASGHFTTIAIGRFLCGVGTGFTIAASTAIMTELAPPGERGFFVAIVDSHWTVGGIFLASTALVCFGFFSISWRTFLALCTLAPLTALILVYCFVPESPRYLAMEGEFQKSADVVNDLAQRLGYFNQLSELGDIRAPLSKSNGQGASFRDDHVDVADADAITAPTPLSVEEVKHYFSTKKATSEEEANSYWKSTLATFQSLCSGNTTKLLFVWMSLSSVGSLSMWLTALFKEVHIQHIYLSTLLTAVSILPGNFAAILLLDRVGRNKVYTGTMILMSFTLAYFSYVATGASLKPFQIVLSASIYNSLLSCGWNAVMVMSGEAFPTRTRYSGLALLATAGRLCGFFSQFWNGALMDEPGKQLSVACGIALVGAFTSWCCSVDEMAQQSVDDFAKGDHEGNDARSAHREEDHNTLQLTELS
jgi:MFS family permease